jgi:hypothetical protein
MDKATEPAPESEADFENIRRSNPERHTVDPESPVSRGDSREGVLAGEDDPHKNNPPASGS